MSEKLQELADRVDKLTPANKLRLAASLIEKGEYELARPIVERISGELALLNLTRGAR